MQINDTARTQIAFGVTVDGWKPGDATVVDDTAFGYPIRSLRDVPEGDYYVQALLNRYETFHRSDGTTVKLHMDQGEGQHWNISPRQHLQQTAEDSRRSRNHSDDHSGSGDSANSGREGHEVHPAPEDSKRVAHEVLGAAHVSVGDCAGAGRF